MGYNNKMKKVPMLLMYISFVRELRYGKTISKMLNSTTVSVHALNIIEIINIDEKNRICSTLRIVRARTELEDAR